MSAPALPAELVREGILLAHSAEEDKSTALSILRVSKDVYLWILPVLFRTVVLTTRHQINAFSRVLKSSVQTTVGQAGTQVSLGSYVRHLWLGPNDRSPTNILQSPRINIWPEFAICAILPLCTSLKSLAISNFPEELWKNITLLVPPSVESIQLGSVRAYMLWDWTQMPCFSTLRCVTSLELDGVWSPRMYKAVATMPSMRTLRRFFPPTPRDTHYNALQRAAALEHSTTMEHVEIIGCTFRTSELAPRWLEKCTKASTGRVGPGRLVLRTVDGTIAWKMFFEDWMDHL
ncbi:hypothetical protein DAEQUDRAFT_763367 [Daedalea quercina L-15889]|uniref:F-box domain-containing protein n=1 Tax=Daedalea quercina L-15889 TaxID=1314783 RepID=A0A165SEI6_9APHY|nr:hypothetical protein DAEQUDRAFT_763367 [Daedalea quercina L-15889]